MEISPPRPPPSREETRTNPSQTRLNEIEYRGNGFSSIDESRSFIFFSFSFSFASRSILSLSLCVCVSGRKIGVCCWYICVVVGTLPTSHIVISSKYTTRVYLEHCFKDDCVYVTVFSKSNGAIISQDPG